MTEETNSTPSGANVSTDDQIANLLMGGEEAETETTETTDNIDTDLGEPETTDDAIEPEEVSEEEAEEEEQSLSAMLGITDDQISVDEETGAFTLQTKVDGKTESIDLKSVLAGYQTQKHNTQTSQALSEQKKVFETQVQAKATEIKQQLDTNTALTSQLFNELTHEYNNTDWNTLRATDPAEWSARQSEMTSRHNQLQQIAGSIAAQRQQGEAQLHQQAQEVQGNYLAQQRDLMVANNPDWNDPAVLKTNLTEIRDWLADTHGFSPDDISSIGDSRAISIIQDAMAFRKGKTVADKKIKSVPKSLIKSSGKRAASKKLSKLDRLTKAAKSAKGASKRQLQDEAVAALLMG